MTRSKKTVLKDEFIGEKMKQSVYNFSNDSGLKYFPSLKASTAIGITYESFLENFVVRP